MNCIKRQKDMTPKEESPRAEGVQYATGEEQGTTTNSPRKDAVAGPKQQQRSGLDASCDERKVQRTVLYKNLKW